MLEDAAILKNYIVYDFLVGLNVKFNQVRVQTLSKKLLTLNETIYTIQAEESRSVVLEPRNLEGSTMVTNKGRDEKANTTNHKRVDWSRVPNHDNKDNLRCTYCQKARHTWERCWKLHGKPSTSNKKWGYNGKQQRDNGQAHLSYVQPVEERSLEQGGCN